MWNACSRDWSIAFLAIQKYILSIEAKQLKKYVWIYFWLFFGGRGGGAYIACL